MSTLVCLLLTKVIYSQTLWACDATKYRGISYASKCRFKSSKDSLTLSECESDCGDVGLSFTWIGDVSSSTDINMEKINDIYPKWFMDVIYIILFLCVMITSWRCIQCGQLLFEYENKWYNSVKDEYINNENMNIDNYMDTNIYYDKVGYELEHFWYDNINQYKNNANYPSLISDELIVEYLIKGKYKLTTDYIMNKININVNNMEYNYIYDCILKYQMNYDENAFLHYNYDKRTLICELNRDNNNNLKEPTDVVYARHYICITVNIYVVYDTMD